MGYYAAFLDVGARDCVVVGGEDLAVDKARGLLVTGARVSVFATKINREMEALAASGQIALLRRDLEAEDLDGCFLVIDASGDDASGVRISEAAQDRGVLVNVLDRPALCTFIAPALVRRGPMQVAISTAGRSPFMASHIRRMLEAELGPEWGELVELVGVLRDRLRAEGMSIDAQTQVYERVPGCGALELLRQGRRAEAAAAVAALAETLAEDG